MGLNLSTPPSGISPGCASLLGTLLLFLLPVWFPLPPAEPGISGPQLAPGHAGSGGLPPDGHLDPCAALSRFLPLPQSLAHQPSAALMVGVALAPTSLFLAIFLAFLLAFFPGFLGRHAFRTCMNSF